MKMINSKHSNSHFYFEKINLIPKSKCSQSKIITAILLICIFIVLVIIIGNLYFIFKNIKIPKDISSNFTTRINFDSKSIICGNESDKHIRTFVKKIGGTGDLAGIKFIIKDNNGKSYSYVNENPASIPNSESAVTRIDVVYSQAGINPSLNISSLESFPMFKDANGKQVFGMSSKSPDVCYSSCNDCSLSCDLICANSTGL